MFRQRRHDGDFNWHGVVKSTIRGWLTSYIVYLDSTISTTWLAEHIVVEYDATLHIYQYLHKSMYDL